jgi:transposase InsO family protein
VRNGLEELQFIVPADDNLLKTELLCCAHGNGAHLDKRKTLAALQQRAFWDGMYADTEDYVRSCYQCQASNNPARGRDALPVGRMPLAQAPMELWSLDVLHMHRTDKHGNQYLVLAVDHYSKYAEARPLRSNESREIALFLFEQIGLRHGFPKVVLTDLGSEFDNNLLKWMCSLSNTTHLRSTPYHPQSHGQVERTHRTLLSQLRKICPSSAASSWDLHVGAAVFAYNTSVHSSTGFTPFFLHHGREAVKDIDGLVPSRVPDSTHDTPFEFAKDLVEVLDAAKAVAVPRLAAKHSLYNRPKVLERLRRPITFQPGEEVMLYTPVTPPSGFHKLSSFWTGPYPVLAKHGPFNYEIMYNDKPYLVHSSRLKLFYRRRADLVDVTAPRPQVTTFVTDVRCPL